MSTDHGAFPALGFDPAPGDADAATSAGRRLSQANTMLTDARTAMSGAMSSASGWTGDAAAGFHDVASEVPRHIAKATDSLQQAGTALTGWSSDLAAMQTQARDLEAQAEAAKQQLRAALANPDLNPPTGPQAAAIAGAAKQAVLGSQDELEAIQAAAKRLLGQHGDLSDQVAKLLSGLDLPKDWWGPISGPDGEWGRDFFAKIDKFLHDNAHAINNIADVTSDLSTVIGVVGAGLDLGGVTAPAGAVLGVVSSALSGVALVGHLAAWRGGVKGAWKDAIGDGVGVASLGIGKVAERVLLKSAGKAASKLPDLLTGNPATYRELEDWFKRSLTIKGTIDNAKSLDGLLTGGHVGKYWLPRKSDPWWAVGSGPVNAYRHAWIDGHKKDLENR